MSFYIPQEGISSIVLQIVVFSIHRSWGNCGGDSETVQFPDKVIVMPVVLATGAVSRQGSLTHPLCSTTGVMVQTVQFLDKVIAVFVVL